MFNILKKYIGPLSMAILLTSALAGVNPGCNTNNIVNTGENNMTDTAPVIPPIDLVAPANFETATFALG